MKLLMLITLFLISCSSKEILNESNQLNERQFAIIKTDEISVMCFYANKNNCGYNLKSCSDGMLHDCVNNVSIFDYDEFMKVKGKGIDR